MNRLHPVAPAAPRRATRIKLPIQSRRIPHNIQHRAMRNKWELIFNRKNCNAIFQDRRGNRAIRGPNEGWSAEDVESFSLYLQGLEGSYPK